MISRSVKKKNVLWLFVLWQLKRKKKKTKIACAYGEELSVLKKE